MTDSTRSYKSTFFRMMLLIFLLPYDSIAHPIYGTKRYGRSAVVPQNNWGMSSVIHVPSYYFQAMPRPHTYHPMNFYDHLNPYAPEYDEYYYQDSLSYPLYYPSYPAARTRDLYQSFLPYYYGERAYPGYYDGVDPIEDIQEEMVQQDQEREHREESLPIGQETWYETDDAASQPGDSLDDVNAAFMKNLMIYNEAKQYDYDNHPTAQAYGQDYNDLSINDWNNDELSVEDEDVLELKTLNENMKKPVANNKQERMRMFQQGGRNHKVASYNPNNSENWINYGNKRTNKQQRNYLKTNTPMSKHDLNKIATQDLTFNPRKTQTLKHDLPNTSTQLPPTLTTKPAGGAFRGQKEVVMMRPATPVRQPFSKPVMKLLAEQGASERKRNPSVYDTIKQMLQMEKSLEKVRIQLNISYLKIFPYI